MITIDYSERPVDWPGDAWHVALIGRDVDEEEVLLTHGPVTQRLSLARARELYHKLGGLLAGADARTQEDVARLMADVETFSRRDWAYAAGAGEDTRSADIDRKLARCRRARYEEGD